MVILRTNKVFNYLPSDDSLIVITEAYEDGKRVEYFRLIRPKRFGFSFSNRYYWNYEFITSRSEEEE